jgi:hypothetical protein
MSASALLWLSLIGGFVALATLLTWFATRRRYAWLRVVAGLSVIVAVVSGYVARQPEKPVVGQGSLVGGQTPGTDPEAARCAQARAFSANVPPECSR